MGNYGFPKGHRDKEDESILDTAIRETKEEVGIKVKKSDILKNKKFITDLYFFRKKKRKTFRMDKEEFSNVNSINRFKKT